MAKVPYSFFAKMMDGTRISQGDHPLMVDDNASAREIEQLILERLQEYGDVESVTWNKMSDYNF